MKRIIYTTLIVSVILIFIMSQLFALKENCFICAFYFIIRNFFHITTQAFLTVLLFVAMRKKITFANIVYTLFGSSGSNYSRVTFDCATSQAQNRMPNIAYTAR